MAFSPIYDLLLSLLFVLISSFCLILAFFCLVSRFLLSFKNAYFPILSSTNTGLEIEISIPEDAETITTTLDGSLISGTLPRLITFRSKHHNPNPSISLSNFRFSRHLASGNSGAVYLAELDRTHIETSSETQLFAAKVMDKSDMVARNREHRVKKEMEILEKLDHPFLPCLFGCIEDSNHICFITEYCNGGDLHTVRLFQPDKRFDYHAVRFYASEVVVALEYLHTLGIVHRDLKPDNVLVKSDGHIMLSDFDVSLQGNEFAATPLIINTEDEEPEHNSITRAMSCFGGCLTRKQKKKRRHHGRTELELVAELTNARSMSFVGTPGYLAPEIVCNDSHATAVDWWTLGVMIFELFYGVTPFHGANIEATIINSVARDVEFPVEPVIPETAKDLISKLLVKDPAERLGSRVGAAEIKRHPFFKGINWALLRCVQPPYVPPAFDGN